MKTLIFSMLLMTSCLPDYSFQERLVDTRWQMTGMTINGTAYFHSCGYSRAKKIFQDTQVIIYPLCEYQDSQVVPYTLEGDALTFDGKTYIITALSNNTLTLQYDYPTGGNAIHHYRSY